MRLARLRTGRTKVSGLLILACPVSAGWRPCQDLKHQKAPKHPLGLGRQGGPEKSFPPSLHSARPNLEKQRKAGSKKRQEVFAQPFVDLQIRDRLKELLFTSHPHLQASKPAVRILSGVWLIWGGQNRPCHGSVIRLCKHLRFCILASTATNCAGAGAADYPHPAGSHAARPQGAASGHKGAARGQGAARRISSRRCSRFTYVRACKTRGAT